MVDPRMQTTLRVFSSNLERSIPAHAGKLMKKGQAIIAKRSILACGVNGIFEYAGQRYYGRSLRMWGKHFLLSQMIFQLGRSMR